MLNSLTIFIIFLVFLLFGYLSFLQLIGRRHNASPSQLLRWNRNTTFDFLAGLGSSAIFIGLPATTLLLFWGWAPALIWIGVFHLLVESVFQIHYASKAKSFSVADALLRSNKKFKGGVEQIIIQAFFLLCMGVVVALVATLLDRQPGLLFALLSLIPARALLRNDSATLNWSVKIIGSMLLLALGLAFSDQLGISVYGDWAPLGSLVPWLVFNMPTLLAAIIVLSVFRLETNKGFKDDLAVFSGAIIFTLTLLMIIKFIWLRPILDAPLNSSQVRSDSLPNLGLICLILFSGFIGFTIRILADEESSTRDGGSVYRRIQSNSLIQTLFLSLLVLSLAAALGIGTWKTHFIEWSNDLNMLDFLNLAITSVLNLVYNFADAGTLLHTALLAALCFTGFSFLLMCANQLSIEEPETETLFSSIVEAKIPQAIGIFLLSAYFIGTGISTTEWMFIGLLGWILFMHFAIGICLLSDRNVFFSSTVLVVLAAGVVQTAFLLFSLISSEEFALFTASLILVVISAYLWANDVKTLIAELSKPDRETIL